MTAGDESGAGERVRALYEAYQDRDWDRAARHLHERCVVEMLATGERIEGREALLAFNRAYPEPWGALTVERVVSDGSVAAGEIRVVDPRGQRFAMAAFWTTEDDLLRSGSEYWVGVASEAPPPGRAAGSETRQARRAWAAARAAAPGADQSAPEDRTG